MKAEVLKINTLLIAIILIVIAGCQSNTTPGNAGQTPPAKLVEKATTKAVVSGCDTTIINQELSDEVLRFKVFKTDTNKIKSLFLGPVVLKPEKHTNPEGGVYYLNNFTDGVNTLVLLRKAGEGFYIEDAYIKNDKMLLNKRLSIGMDKGALLKLLNVQSVKCDTIIAQDEESTFESVYIFKANKLAQIKMGQIIE